MMSLRKLAIVRIAGITALLGETNCVTPLPECPFHCWESSVLQEDLPEDPERPGYFSMQCVDQGGAAVFVPVPENGFGAKACFTGSTGPTDYPGPALNSEKHFFMKLAVLALGQGWVLTAAQEAAYEDWVGALREAVLDTCVQALSCDGKPGTCDIDPDTPGDQLCTVATATSLCDLLVAEELVNLVSLPNPTKYPECSGTNIMPVFDPDGMGICEGFVPDMTGGQCEDLPPSTEKTDLGADDGFGTGLDGADSESGSGAGVQPDPFGDVGSLVHCMRNDCIVDPQLVANVSNSFGVIYDEGAQLELVDGTVRCGPGARFGGLALGTASAGLARPFGIDNGDVVTRLNGMAITGAEDVLAALDMIAGETVFKIDVSKPVGSGCGTRTLNLQVKR